MRRGKKLLIIAVLAAVMLGGTIGGIVLANNNGDGSQPGAAFGTLWDKACAIYEQKTGVAIDQEVFKDSLAQAQSEIRDEAMQNRLQRRVEEGVMTQEQADQYKAWLESKPDVPMMSGFGNSGGERGGPHCWGGFGHTPAE